jgi:hypothetical protein
MNKKMKILTTLMSLFVVTTVISCSDDDNNDNQNLSIIGKWEIKTLGSVYASFEFTSDRDYIVLENLLATTTASSIGTSSKSLFSQKNSLTVKSNISATESDTESNLSPIHYGTYTINGDVITLSGFGVLNIISLTAEEFTFSFTLTANGETGEYTANLTAPPISESSRTKMMCRTWETQSIEINEDDMPNYAKEEYIDMYGEGWKDSVLKNTDDVKTILMSRAGTYLVLYEDENSEAGLAEWKWANSEETAFYYSWHNWQNGWDDDIAYITELTGTKFTVKDKYFIYHLVIIE